MELFTVGYEGRTLPQFVRLLREHRIERLIDVRERPVSRKKGFSAVPLFEALRKVGIAYELGFGLGNPEPIRAFWKNGQLARGKTRYRELIRDGRSDSVGRVLRLAKAGAVCLLCLEDDPELCHRSIIAEEVARLDPAVTVRHL